MVGKGAAIAPWGRHGAQGLGELGLVDEYRLMVYPVLLGAGKRLFADTSSAASLRPTDVRLLGEDGVAILTYVPAT